MTTIAKGDVLYNMSLKLRDAKTFSFNGIIFRSAGRLYNNTWKLEINKRIFGKKVFSTFFLSLLSFPLKCKVGRRTPGIEHKYK